MIEVGKVYENRSENAYPSDLSGALLTITRISEGEGCVVAYDYTTKKGQTGSGTMTMAATRQLKPV